MSKIIILSVFGIAVLLLGIFVFNWEPTGKTNNNVLGAVSPFTDLTPDQFNQMLGSGKYTLIDVRTLDEYNAGHLKNTKQTDYYKTNEFSSYLDSLDKKANYLIYCRTGHRSSEAMKIMQEKGFRNVYDMSGGYNAWLSNGFPIEK